MKMSLNGSVPSAASQAPATTPAAPAQAPAAAPAVNQAPIVPPVAAQLPVAGGAVPQPAGVPQGAQQPPTASNGPVGAPPVASAPPQGTNQPPTGAPQAPQAAGAVAAPPVAQTVAAPPQAAGGPPTASTAGAPVGPGVPEAPMVQVLPPLKPGAAVIAKAQNGEFEGQVMVVNGDEVVVDIGGTGYAFPVASVEPKLEIAPAAPTVPVITNAPAPVGTEESVAVMAPTKSVTVPAMNVPGMGSILGDIQDTDFNWPRINLVQAVGPLSESWPAGAFLYNKNFCIAWATDQQQPTGPAIPLTVLDVRKQYQENLPYGADEVADVVDSIEEVTARGGTIKWAGDEPPSWNPIAHLLVLVGATTDQAMQTYPYEYNGMKYGAALFTVRKTSYKVFKDVMTACRGRLANGLRTGGWNLYAKRERKGQNMVWVPHLQPAGQYDAGMLQFVTGLAL